MELIALYIVFFIILIFIIRLIPILLPVVLVAYVGFYIYRIFTRNKNSSGTTTVEHNQTRPNDSNVYDDVEYTEEEIDGDDQ